jgi:hypothetical protein
MCRIISLLPALRIPETLRESYPIRVFETVSFKIAMRSTPEHRPAVRLE